MDNNPGQFGDLVRNPLEEEDTNETTTRDTDSSRYESEEEWERTLGARNMDLSCFWYFDSDEIIAKHNGVHGRGDTVADALDDLVEGLRRRRSD